MIAVLLQTGDHLVCSDAVYGSTCILVETILSRFGIEYTMVDTSGLTAIEGTMRPNTKTVYIETPGKPSLVVCDLERVCRMACERGAQVVVDNTFMTPALQQPLRWGVDVIAHSLTKFLNGHAGMVGGMISFSLKGGLDAVGLSAVQWTSPRRLRAEVVTARLTPYAIFSLFGLSERSRCSG